MKVDGDASEDRVVLELQRCLSREIEAILRTSAPELANGTTAAREAANESENSLFFDEMA